MGPQQGVLLVTQELETASAVATALELNGSFAAEDKCADLRQLVARLEGTAAPAALVDIDPRPNGMLADLGPLITRFSDTRFVVLSTAQRSDWILEAMQIGVRHFLVKQSIGVDLAGVLKRLIPDGAARAGGEGAIVTVLSAGGGCGATTVAVNLANELQLLGCGTSLIVDLDCSYGAVAGYLGLEGQYGLANVLADRDRIDSELIRSTALDYSKGLDVLASPASINPTSIAPLEYPHLGQALDACKQAYACTVIDAPRVTLDVASSLAKASRVAFIVFQLSVKDVRVARSLSSALNERGVAADRMVGLASRYRKRRSMVTLEAAQSALDGLSIECIGNDYQSASLGINYGQPLAEAAPRSALRRDLCRLAVKLSEAYLPRTLAKASG